MKISGVSCETNSDFWFFWDTLLCSFYPYDSTRNSLIQERFQLFPELKYKCYQKFVSIAPSLTVIDFFAPEINWSVVEYLFPHQRKFQISCWMWQKKTKNMIAGNLSITKNGKPSWTVEQKKTVFWWDQVWDPSGCWVMFCSCYTY